MQSDRQLKYWLDKYNREFFGGELPPCVIYWEPPVNGHAETCPVWEVADGKFEIKLDPILKAVPWAIKIALLHECVHLVLWKAYPKHQHGKQFQEEMLRLAQAGAMKKLW